MLAIKRVNIFYFQEMPWMPYDPHGYHKDSRTIMQLNKVVVNHQEVPLHRLMKVAPSGLHRFENQVLCPQLEKSFVSLDQNQKISESKGV
jgi:hypothetical protein